MTVTVDDFAFRPQTATVAVGGTVTWTWIGSEQHNVTGSFGQSPLQNAGTYSITFTTPGTYEYRCSIHSLGATKMTGTIVVE